MTHESLLNADWRCVVGRLGGARSLESGARELGAFTRARAVKCAVDLLRLVLAYCLSHDGLRATAAWAEGSGLASLSNVALLGRLRKVTPWLEKLVGDLIARDLQRVTAGKGRPIRIIDATILPRAGKLGRHHGGAWRVHAIFDLPTERFSTFDLTDERESERLDRGQVVKGEIRIADRGYAHTASMRRVMDAGADIIVRVGWKNMRWLDESGEAVNVIGLLDSTRASTIDRRIWIKQGSQEPLAVRLVAARKSKQQTAAARTKARRRANDHGRVVLPETLVAAEWFILVTTLDKVAFPAKNVLALYRLRWRIEIAFKRLKSLVGLNRPPGEDPAVAKAHVLCHLLAILLTEPVADALGDSPRLGHAPSPAIGGCSA